MELAFVAVAVAAAAAAVVIVVVAVVDARGRRRLFTCVIVMLGRTILSYYIFFWRSYFRQKS